MKMMSPNASYLEYTLLRLFAFNSIPTTIDQEQRRQVDLISALFRECGSLVRPLSKPT